MRVDRAPVVRGWKAQMKETARLFGPLILVAAVTGGSLAFPTVARRTAKDAGRLLSRGLGLFLRSG